MADIVWIEQGAITIPEVRKEPLASRQPISSGGYVQVARARKSAADFPSSRNAVRSPERERTKWTSVSGRELSFSSKRQPYIDPLAPVTPRIIRYFGAAVSAPAVLI